MALRGIPLLFLALLIGPEAAADPMEVEILAGNLAGIREPSSPSADLAAAAFFATGGDLKDFNQNSFDKSLIHSFVGLPAGIVAATLEIEIAVGTGWWGAGAKDDGVVLLFVGPGDGFATAQSYERIFGQCDVPSGPNECPQPGELVFTQPDPSGVLAELDPPQIGWEASGQKVLLPSFDLAALPEQGGGALDLIPSLNSAGFLDVFIGDDTSVGYMRLTLTVDPDSIPDPVPALPSWSLGLVIALLLAASQRSLARRRLS